MVVVVLCGLYSCKPASKPSPPPPKEKEEVVPQPPLPDPTPDPVPTPGKTDKALELTVGTFESNTFVLDGYEIAYEQF